MRSGQEIAQDTRKLAALNCQNADSTVMRGASSHSYEMQVPWTTAATYGCLLVSEHLPASAPIRRWDTA